MRSRELIDTFNKPVRLVDELLPFIEGKKEVKIADIGSGPVSSIGSYLPGVKVEVYPSDTQDFTSWWQKRREWWKDDDLKPYIPVEVQNMEKLTYPNNYFDIVWCHNALDHTRNAEIAVKEFKRVCKKGGWIYIMCSLNQLDTGYLHFWNTKKDGVFDNYKERFDLKDYGFKIKYTDNGDESRYSFIEATLNK
jgi:SAM-dependent methyltransferase